MPQSSDMAFVAGADFHGLQNITKVFEFCRISLRFGEFTDQSYFDSKTILSVHSIKSANSKVIKSGIGYDIGNLFFYLDSIGDSIGGKNFSSVWLRQHIVAHIGNVVGMPSATFFLHRVSIV